MTEIAGGPGDEAIDDPIMQLREDVAELLASLSSETDTPSDFDVSQGPFDSDDVKFDSDDWMSCIAAIQGWLRLETPLVTDSTDEFLWSLANVLGFDSTTDAVNPRAPFPTLNAVALDRLRERAERAARLQRLFIEEYLSEGGTRDSATRIWTTAWEEDEDIEDTASAEPVSAKADTWRITEFVAQAQGQKLNLTPSYQRGDVWRTSARQILIESILRGIPLPSVILLKPSDAQAQPYEVVDGKQRLTSILRFVGKHPLALGRVRRADKDHPGANLLNLFNTNYPQFKRAWKGVGYEPLTSSLEEQYYFPFKLRTDDRGLAGEELAPLRGKYYTEIKDRTIRVADQTVSVEEVFEGYSDYRVPIIVYSRATQHQIHEVFNLYNKQGTHLNAEEIRNAIFHELEITRATLVAAGDSDARTPPGAIAPSLEAGWDAIKPLQETLRGYGFGDSRYRRTKVLSWILATLLVEGKGDKLPSTAKHIDSLLQRVQADRQDPLRNGDTIRAVFEWVARAAEAHAGFAEAWAPAFKDGETGTKWQELQLVGSLVGIAIASAVFGDALDERLAEAAPAIYEASKGWKRPSKTQTRTQWGFISKVAQGVTQQLDADAVTASALLKAKFGSSGIDTLWAVTADDSAG